MAQPNLIKKPCTTNKGTICAKKCEKKNSSPNTTNLILNLTYLICHT